MRGGSFKRLNNMRFRPAQTPGNPKIGRKWGPRAPQISSDRPRKSLDFEVGVGDRLPTCWKGLRGPRSRPDPQNDRLLTLKQFHIPSQSTDTGPGTENTIEQPKISTEAASHKESPPSCKDSSRLSYGRPRKTTLKPL